MKKVLNLFMLILMFFFSIDASYGNNMGIKKVKYANNIYYEGEAIRVGRTWQPMGEGVLFFMEKNSGAMISCFKIVGIFNNTEVENARLSVVKQQYKYQSGVFFEQTATTTIAKQDSEIFEGEMSFTISAVENLSFDGIPLPGTKGDGEISLFFEKGKFSFSQFGTIENFEPFSIVYNTQGDSEGVSFSATLSRSEKMHLFDPYGIKSGVPYQVSANLEVFGRNAAFCAVEESKMKWEDGSEAIIRPILQVTRGNRRWWDIFAAEEDYISKTDDIAVLARYNEKEYVVYPDLKKNDYIKSAFKSRFYRVLSDGTIVSGVHEENTPHIRYIKCTDGRSFKSTKGVGAMVKGGETVKQLFSNQTLTKEDITFVGGTLYDTEGKEVDTFGAGVGAYGELPHF